MKRILILLISLLLTGCGKQIDLTGLIEKERVTIAGSSSYDIEYKYDKRSTNVAKKITYTLNGKQYLINEYTYENALLIKEVETIKDDEDYLHVIEYKYSDLGQLLQIIDKTTSKSNPDINCQIITVYDYSEEDVIWIEETTSYAFQQLATVVDTVINYENNRVASVFTNEVTVGYYYMEEYFYSDDNLVLVDVYTFQNDGYQKSGKREYQYNEANQLIAEYDYQFEYSETDPIIRYEYSYKDNMLVKKDQYNYGLTRANESIEYFYY